MESGIVEVQWNVQSVVLTAAKPLDERGNLPFKE